jgi:hypothetical protein
MNPGRVAWVEACKADGSPIPQAGTLCWHVGRLSGLVFHNWADGLSTSVNLSIFVLFLY